jgi:phosphoribosylamine-glycine ligase
MPEQKNRMDAFLQKRVLGVTSVAPTLQEAVDHVYQRCSFIQFEEAYYRKDIAHRVLKS